MPNLGVAQSIRREKTGAKSNFVTLDRRRVPKRSQNGNATTDTSTAWLNRDVLCRLTLKEIGSSEAEHGAQFEISIDGVPRTYRDRQDIALQNARFLKSRNPHSVVKLKDLQTGEETVVAFKSE
jgi:hypothetical protein